MYVAEYDFGGNMDARDVVFPILYEIFSEKEDADHWLHKNIRNKYSGYNQYTDLQIYSVEVSAQLLFPEML